MTEEIEITSTFLTVSSDVPHPDKSYEIDIFKLLPSIDPLFAIVKDLTSRIEVLEADLKRREDIEERLFRNDD
ncbi:MAG TPA: hypothetical protein VJ599_00845 [Nitrososphaeraceae archaeon]|nr:hypothetical protein [Nitrososphaeraceae archaeon]